MKDKVKLSDLHWSAAVPIYLFWAYAVILLIGFVLIGFDYFTGVLS